MPTDTHPRQAGATAGDVVLRDVLDRIGDKWSIIVICRLDNGPLRFNQLRRATGGITQRMLSTTVRRLERDGLVRRTVHDTVPPQVEYALTDRGHSLHTIMAQLVDWTHEHVEGILRSRHDYDNHRELAPSDR